MKGWIALAMMGLLLPAGASAAPTTVVETQSGPVQGVVDEMGVSSFLGLPFAAPPVGALRWKAPVDPESWSDTFQATDLAPACLQMGSDGDGNTTAVGSEDCLYLNIWRPEGADEGPLPVMLWIHGGGNTTGATNLPLYDGAALANHGNVIVVSIQYRLHYLGYFNHPDLYINDAVEDSGNYGLLDQIKSLQWVQDNIAEFGGDPNRVTIFGESAGGVNAWGLMLSEMAQGLFHRAIMQSGCLDFVHLNTAKARSARNVEYLVIADGLATEETAADFIASQEEGWVTEYLYGKGADEILLALDEAGAIVMTDYYPIQEGTVFPVDALNKVQLGDYHGVPTIIGSNADESKLFTFAFNGMGPMVYHQAMDMFYGEDVADINRLYPLWDYEEPRYYNRFADIADWYLELLCSDDAAMMVADHHDTWLYKFKYDNLIEPYDMWFGAGHGFELPFVFNHFNDEFYPPESGDERALLSAQMMDAWSCFAYEGDPTACAGTVAWPRMSGGITGSDRLLWDSTISVDRVSNDEIQKIEYWKSLGGLEDMGRFTAEESRAHGRLMEALSGR